LSKRNDYIFLLQTFYSLSFLFFFGKKCYLWYLFFSPSGRFSFLFLPSFSFLIFTFFHYSSAWSFRPLYLSPISLLFVLASSIFKLPFYSSAPIFFLLFAFFPHFFTLFVFAPGLFLGALPPALLPSTLL